MPLLECRDVSKHFDKGAIRALSGISLSIGLEERVAIVGPNGSGKSTLINILCGLDTPTHGDVLFHGQLVRSHDEWTNIRRRSMGIVFQHFHLLASLSAMENVEVAMIGLRGSAERSRVARQLLESVGVGHRIRNHPPELSGGERQRVAIARALANGPEILVADEPTGNLDQTTSAAVINLLFDMAARARTAILLVTHDQALVERCDRQVEMRDGAIHSDLPHALAADKSKQGAGTHLLSRQP